MLESINVLKRDRSTRVPLDEDFCRLVYTFMKFSFFSLSQRGYFKGAEDEGAPLVAHVISDSFVFSKPKRRLK